MKKRLSIWLCIALVLSLVFLPDLTEAKKSKIKLNKKKVTLYVGKKVRLKVKGTKKKVKWSSNKKKVATVSKKGKVKAKRKGTARITAKVAGKKLVCKVKVKNKKKPTPTPVVTKKPTVTKKPATGKPTDTEKPNISEESEKPTTPTPKATKTPTPVVVKSASFSSDTDGFTGRGDDVTVSSVSGGYTGNCLSVTGRTASSHGAAYEAKNAVIPGETYRIEAYVKLASGTGTVKCTYQSGADSHTEIASVDADTTWKKISATFTVPSSFAQSLIYFEIENDATTSFYLDEVVLTRLTKTENIEVASIKDAYASTLGEIGTCLNLSQMKDAKTLAYVKKHYTSFTLENEMKPDSILGGWSPTIIDVSVARNRAGDYIIPGSYTETKIPDLKFSTVDEALRIAKSNGLKMRAHTLVWHSQTPEWFFKEGYSSNGAYVSATVMNARMEMYIRSVMHHVYTLDNGAYKDVVYAWDVANEYLHNNAGANWSAVYGNRAGNLENRPPYLKKAFEIAYDMLKSFEIQDSVSLFYNDFNTYVEGHPQSIIDMIAYINAGEDAKICQGIGMQSHLDVDYPSVDLFVNTAKEFADAELEVQITELDVTINNLEGNYKNENQTDEQQAEYIGEMMKKLIEVQKSSNNAITGLTLWGLYDAVSWRGGKQWGGKNSHPLLFDLNINDPKPSYYSFMGAIQKED